MHTFVPGSDGNGKKERKKRKEKEGGREGERKLEDTEHWFQEVFII